MMKTKPALFGKYHIPFEEQELKQVFTHTSFSENNNSRFVFLGMFAFKGLVCNYVYHHIAGTGTQLQHFLGNIFRQSFLEKFFENFFVKNRLKQYCRFTGIDIDRQRHIFVYALLGYIYENTDEQHLEQFIYENFILPNDHHLPQNYRQKNLWDQLIFLCKQHFDQKPKLLLRLDEEKINHIEIYLDSECIATHSSISYKYAKKKAITLALKHIGAELENRISQDKTYQENARKKEEEIQLLKQQQKEEKQRKHIERNQSHAERMREKRILEIQKAREEDKKRRETKEKIKEKSEKKVRTIHKEYTKEEIAAMSNAKRRNLQDRGIIPKGI